MTGFSGLSQPMLCQSIVLADALSVKVGKAEVILAFVVAAFSASSKPVQGVTVVAPHSYTVRISRAKIALSPRQTRKSSLPVKIERRSEIFCHTLPGFVAES